MKKHESMKSWGFTLLTLVLLMAAAPGLNAQQANPLKVTFTNRTLQHDTARARKQPGTVAVPNDTLQYVLTFENTQKIAVKNVVFTNPLPKGLAFINGSVTTSLPSKVEYSIDGGVTYAEKPIVTVEENGRRVQRPATPESYTHIRWTVTDSLAPGATVTAKYDARVAGR